MKNNRQKNSEGISLRVLHIAMVVCAVIISLLLIFSTYQSANVFTTLNKATGNYIVRQEAAHELMEASDYLTEMVQRFISRKRSYPSAGRLPSPAWLKAKQRRSLSPSCRLPWMSPHP